MFEKGHRINIGRKHIFETRKKVGEAKKGNKNPAWQGNKVGYKALHTWLRKNYSQPDKCQRCGKITDKLELSCNGNYTRDIKDYEWLCRSCHWKKDKAGERLPKFKGEAHPRAELMEKQVLEIRELYKTNKYLQKELAKKFSISKSVINHIILRKIWKHI